MNKQQLFLHGHYKQIDCICNIFDTTFNPIYMYQHDSDHLVSSFGIFFPVAWGCVSTPKACTTKNTIAMSIYFETLQLSSSWKLVTNLKNETLLKISIFNFFLVFFFHRSQVECYHLLFFLWPIFLIKL